MNATLTPKGAESNGATDPHQFYHTQGSLRAGRACYVTREADARLLGSLREGHFCYVLNARQMGKSSLMLNVRQRLREAGTMVGVIDLSSIGNNVTSEQWYFTMMETVGDALSLTPEMEAYWETHQGESPMRRGLGAICEVLLAAAEKQVVIFVDEIDAVLNLPFSADEFFAGIRETYNRRSQRPELERLTFCLLGTSTPSTLIRDSRTTPFNIGVAVELKDFTAEEAAVLKQGLAADDRTASAMLERILYWTGGQPYLTQRLCVAAAEGNARSAPDIDRLCTECFLSAHTREADYNLGNINKRLLQSKIEPSALLDLYAKIYRGMRIFDDELDPVVTELRLSGVVAARSGYLQVRNRVYRKVFTLEWVRGNLPGAELRRQRDAFYRGVRRVMSSAALVMAAMTVLVIFALRARQEAERARLEAEHARQEAEAQTVRYRAEAERNEQLSKALGTQADQLRSQKLEIEHDLIRKLGKTGDLLESIKPMLGIKSSARDDVLRAARELTYIENNETAKLPRVQLQQAKLLRVFTGMYLALGKNSEALEEARRAREIVLAWLQKDPSNAQLKLQLIECNSTIGQAALGDRDVDTIALWTDQQLSEALNAFDENLKIAQKLYDEDRSNRDWQRTLLGCYHSEGDVQLRSRRWEDARKAYSAAEKLARTLRDENVDDPEWQESLATTLDRLGEYALGRDRNDQAAELFQEGLEIRQALSRKNPSDVTRMGRVAMSLNKLGRAAHEKGNLDGALAYYKEALKRREEVFGIDNSNPASQRDLAFSYNNVASASLAKRDFAGALKGYEKRHDLCRALFESNPSNDNYRIDYGEGLLRFADILLNRPQATKADWEKALRFCRQAVLEYGLTGPKFLQIYAQALRYNGDAAECQRYATRGIEMLENEKNLTKGQKELLLDLREQFRNAHKRPLSPKGR